MLKKTLLAALLAAVILALLAMLAGAGPKTGVSATAFIASPSDYFSGDAVKAYTDKVIVNVWKPRFVTYTDTKSMAPVIGVSTTGIEVAATEPKIGDIVSYEAGWSKELVTHRIVGNGVDEKGIYFTLKGDANSKADPGKVRPWQIKYRVVALFY